MADFIITDTLANEILAFLDTKPHKEVRRLIDQLAQIKPVPVPVPAPVPKKEGEVNPAA